MRHFSSSGLRTSISAAAAVTVTALTVFLFESPYTAWGSRTQPPTEAAALTITATPDAASVA